MKRFALLIPTVALACALAQAPIAAQPAQTQPPGGTKRGGKGSIALPTTLRYLAEKTVRDDLKLSEEQAKKVADLRVRWQKEAPSNIQSEANRELVAKLTSAVEKEAAGLLDAAQTKRLKQIELRQGLPTGSEAGVFALPNALAELKLNDEQSAKIKSIQDERRKALMALFLADERAAEIAKKVEAHKQETYGQLRALLNAGQQKQLQELLGEPLTGGLLWPSPRGFPAGPATDRTPGDNRSANTTPLYVSISGLLFVDRKAIQEELKLTADQLKRLTELVAKTRARTTAIVTETAVGEQREKLRAEQAKDNEKVLAEILQPEQLTRFKQVVLQVYTVNRIYSIFGSVGRLVEVNEGLQLTKEQKARLVQGEALANMLNDKQQAKWKEMTGKPFEGATAPVTPTTGPRTAITPVYLSVSGLLFTTSKPLQEELKLTEDQSKRLNELRATSTARTREITQLGRRSPEAEKQDAQQAADNDKALAEILKPEQLARFKQIMLQVYAKLALSAPGFAILGRIVEVSEGLKLTKEQKDRLAGQEALTTVLDEAQQAKWKEMLGKPFEPLPSPLGQRVGGPTARTTALANVMLQHLGVQSVQEDLKLSSDQLKKLPELTQKWTDLSKDLNGAGGGSRTSPEERTKKLAEARTAFNKEIAGLLDAKQLARLHQIGLQQTQKNGTTTLLAAAAVRKELELTEDQSKKLAELNFDAASTRTSLIRELGRADSVKALADFNALVDKKLNAVLTPAQHDKLKALLGEPFKGELGNPGGRNRGGAAPIPDDNLAHFR